MKYTNLIRNKIRRLKRGKYYNIDGFKLEVGYEHDLPFFQEWYPMYDRFLPFFVEGIETKGKYIIDVGANVGDTVASMIKHNDATFICIEGSEFFFNILANNLKKFEKYKDRIVLEKALIVNESDVGKAYTIEMNAGTGHKVNSGISRVDTKTIAQVIDERNISIEDVVLIKTDTDGFDADCIMSIGSELKDSNAILYWENQIFHKEQYHKYKDMADFLNTMGYCRFYVFDNYGNYITETDYCGFVDVLNYLYRIAKGMSRETFQYVDVLCIKQERIANVDDLIHKYVSRF